MKRTSLHAAILVLVTGLSPQVSSMEPEQTFEDWATGVTYDYSSGEVLGYWASTVDEDRAILQYRCEWPTGGVDEYLEITSSSFGSTTKEETGNYHVEVSIDPRYRVVVEMIFDARQKTLSPLDFDSMYNLRSMISGSQTVAFLVINMRGSDRMLTFSALGANTAINFADANCYSRF